MGYKPDPAHCSSQKIEEQHKFKIYCSKTLRAWIWKERLEFKHAGVVLQFQFEDVEDLDLEEKTWVWNTDFQAWIYSSSSTTLRTWIWKKRLELNTSRRGFTVPGLKFEEQYKFKIHCSKTRRAWIWKKRLEFEPPDVDLQFQFEDIEDLDLEELTWI